MDDVYVRNTGDVSGAGVYGDLALKGIGCGLGIVRVGMVAMANAAADIAVPPAAPFTSLASVELFGPLVLKTMQLCTSFVVGTIQISNGSSEREVNVTDHAFNLVEWWSLPGATKLLGEVTGNEKIQDLGATASLMESWESAYGASGLEHAMKIADVSKELREFEKQMMDRLQNQERSKLNDFLKDPERTKLEVNPYNLPNKLPSETPIEHPTGINDYGDVVV